MGREEQVRDAKCTRPSLSVEGLVPRLVSHVQRICSAGIYSLADLFRISKKSANLFRMGNGR